MCIRDSEWIEAEDMEKVTKKADELGKKLLKELLRMEEVSPVSYTHLGDPL